MKRVLLKPAFALVLVALCGVLAFGQTGTTGQIVGTVADPSGAVVAGATVTAKNNATGQEITDTSSGEGTYTLPGVNVGTYTVTITNAGFKTAQLVDVVVNAGNVTTANVVLEVGAPTETVTITGAGSEIINTQNANIGQTITGRQITDLPQASRDALDLVLLLPGTNTPGRPRTSTVNGLPKTAINITYDGINVQDNVLKGSDGFFTFVRPRVDAVGEVSISTSNPGAESSGEGAVQIKFTTPSGGNEYHGAAFWNHRNPSLNANFWYNNRDLPEDPVDRKAPRTRQLLNQPGFKIGGPVSIPGLFSGRDRLFFFVNYEEFRLPEAQLRTRSLLTPSAQAGNFSYVTPSGVRTVNLLNLAGANGFTATPDPTISTLFNSIRSSVSGLNITQTADPNVQNVTFINTGMQVRRFPTGRLDWNVTKNHHAEAVYNYQQFDSNVDFLNGTDPAFPGFPNFGSQKSNRFSYVGALRSTLTQSLVNEVRYGGTGGTVLFFPECNAGQFANQAGFSLGIGSAGVSGATTCNTPQRRNSPVQQFTDTLTYVRGQHNFNFGMAFSQINAWLVSAPGGAVPTISFAADFTDPVTDVFDFPAFPGASAAQLVAAENLYRTLVGRINNISGVASLIEDGSRYVFQDNRVERYRQRELGFFGQDSWRIRPNLTLNLGMRYELQYAPTSQNKALTQNTFAGLFGASGNTLESTLFRPGATGGTPTSFIPLPPGQHFHETDTNNFAPSVGFAWQPDFSNSMLKRFFGDSGQTVIRGGYSIAYLREGLNLASSIMGFNYGGVVDASRITGIEIPYGSLLRNVNSLPAPTFAAAPTFPLVPNVFDSAAANAFDPNLKTPYVISFSGGLQRELTKDTVFEIRYVGNRGKQLFRQQNLNETNVIENGFGQEFLLAQQNLRANIAAGRGTNFRYFGPGTGTSPLPTILAYFRGSSAASPINPNNPAQYTSAFFANATFARSLSFTNPTPQTFAALLNNPLNGLTPNAASAGLPANFFVVNPQLLFGGTFYVNNDAKTWYDGMTVEVRRRMSRGLLMQANYTFSKSLTNFYASSSIAFAQPATLRNTWLNKTFSPFDIRHAFKMNYIYELPVGRGQRFLGGVGKWGDALVGGWTVNGTTRLQSGSPINFGNVQLVGMTAEDLQRAIEIRKTPTDVRWLADDIALNTFRAFNATTTGFAQGTPVGPHIAPASSNGCVQFFGGQCGFTSLVLHGPRFLRIDMSLVKKIKFTESTNLELRAEALNAINNINFKVGTYATDAVAVGGAGIPTYSSTLFGRLNSPDTAYRDTSTTNDPGGRIVQLVVRFNF